MKNFYQYLAESTKTYTYRIRSVCEINDGSLDAISRVIEPYDPVEISEFKKTPIQESPLDFPNFTMCEVWIVDVTTKVPVSNYILQEKLRAALNQPDSTLMVRMENDPTELETMRLDNFADWDTIQDPLVSDSPIYHEYNYDADKEPAYGDEYNKKLLNYLAAVKRDRAEVVGNVQPEHLPPNAFSWLEDNESDIQAEDFNKDYDTVKPVPSSEIGDKEIPEPAKVAVTGNYDSISRIDSKEVVRK